MSKIKASISVKPNKIKEIDIYLDLTPKKTRNVREDFKKKIGSLVLQPSKTMDSKKEQSRVPFKEAMLNQKTTSVEKSDPATGVTNSPIVTIRPQLPIKEQEKIEIKPVVENPKPSACTSISNPVVPSTSLSGLITSIEKLTHKQEP